MALRFTKSRKQQMTQYTDIPPELMGKSDPDDLWIKAQLIRIDPSIEHYDTEHSVARATRLLVLELRDKLATPQAETGGPAFPAFEVRTHDTGDPVAILKGIDEYGPVVDWYKHWVTVPIGTNFYAAAQQQRVSLTDGELDVCRQWFNSIQDTNGGYLTGHDYVLAEKLCLHLGLRVPDSVKQATPPAAQPAVQHLPADDTEGGAA